jgi:hypothetical protein
MGKWLYSLFHLEPIEESHKWRAIILRKKWLNAKRVVSLLVQNFLSQKGKG